MVSNSCFCGAQVDGRHQRCIRCGATMCDDCARLADTTGPMTGLGPECNPGLLDKRRGAQADAAGEPPGGGRELRTPLSGGGKAR